MKNDFLQFLETSVVSIQEPENLFSGLRVSPHFAVPDNILVFYHTFAVQAPNSHGRYTMVIPLDEMNYYVERELIQMGPGSILLIPPFALRFMHPDSHGYRRLFITFELTSPQDYVKNGLCEINDEASFRLKAFLTEYRNGNAQLSALQLASLLESLTLKEQTSVPRRKLGIYLEKALEIVDSDLSMVGGIKEIAAEIGLSESYLRVLFRQEFGISLGQYIVDKRIEAAKYKLLNTQDSLARIAQDCGFNNVFVFSTFFKRHAGCPPGQYRKQFSK